MENELDEIELFKFFLLDWQYTNHSYTFLLHQSYRCTRFFLGRIHRPEDRCKLGLFPQGRTPLDEGKWDRDHYESEAAK